MLNKNFLSLHKLSLVFLVLPFYLCTNCLLFFVLLLLYPCTNRLLFFPSMHKLSVILMCCSSVSYLHKTVFCCVLYPHTNYVLLFLWFIPTQTVCCCLVFCKRIFSFLFWHGMYENVLKNTFSHDLF